MLEEAEAGHLENLEITVKNDTRIVHNDGFPVGFHITGTLFQGGFNTPEGRFDFCIRTGSME